MLTKTYVAKDMRHALQLIREELGSEAVILSSGKHSDGVEVVAGEPETLALQREKIQQNKTRNQKYIEAFESQEPSQTARPDANKMASKDSLVGMLNEAKRGAQKTQAKPSDQAVTARTVNASHDLLVKGKTSKPQASLQSKLDSSEPETTAMVQSNLAPASVDVKAHALVQQKRDLEGQVLSLNSEVNLLKGILNEQMRKSQWVQLNQSQPIQSHLVQGLAELGVTPTLCKTIVKSVHQHDSEGTAWVDAMSTLESMLMTQQRQAKDLRGKLALVGPNGAGKTTSLMKLATEFVMHHHGDDLAIVTTDIFRIGAQDQLKTFASILGCELYVVNGEESMQQTLESLASKPLVLFDTAGLGMGSAQWQEQQALLQPHLSDMEVLLVLPSTLAAGVMRNFSRAYACFCPDGAILTKIDEASSLGEALSILIESELCLNWVTDGLSIPDDIHSARAADMIAQTKFLASNISPSDLDSMEMASYLSEMLQDNTSIAS